MYVNQCKKKKIINQYNPNHTFIVTSHIFYIFYIKNEKNINRVKFPQLSSFSFPTHIIFISFSIILIDKKV